MLFVRFLIAVCTLWVRPQVLQIETSCTALYVGNMNNVGKHYAEFS